MLFGYYSILGFPKWIVNIRHYFSNFPNLPFSLFEFKSWSLMLWTGDFLLQVTFKKLRILRWTKKIWDGGTVWIFFFFFDNSIVGERDLNPLCWKHQGRSVWILSINYCWSFWFYVALADCETLNIDMLVKIWSGFTLWLVWKEPPAPFWTLKGLDKLKSLMLYTLFEWSRVWGFTHWATIFEFHSSLRFDGWFL